MKCDGCGNPEARRISRDSEGREGCDACAGLGSLKRAKNTGLMFGDRLLHKNSNLELARNVRQEYRGDNSDSTRGPNA